MKGLIRTICSVFLVTLISACTPVYDTTYEYVPLHGYQGEACANKCFANRNTCSGNCTSTHNNCKATATIINPTDQITKAGMSRNTGIGSAPNITTYHRNNCDIRPCNESCELDLKRCYQACGGRVKEHKVCTAFCN